MMGRGKKDQGGCDLLLYEDESWRTGNCLFETLRCCELSLRGLTLLVLVG